MPPDSRVNTGVITKSVHGTDGAAEPRTLIVSGIGRSGTSMVAGLLRQAGVFLGDTLHDVVLEDAEVLELMRRHNASGLRRLIARRNAERAVWGFKLPNLHAYLRHDELSLFRNPRLVLIFRDPVAVSVRYAIADHYDVMDTMTNITSAQHGLAQFMLRAKCPALLLSYEKALVTPHAVIDSLMEFCGVTLPDSERSAVLAEIRPNSPEYLATSSSRFEGCIDGIRDGQLYGWCWQVGRSDSLEVDILANGVLLRSVLANRFREDLVKAGLGNGCHGFFLDLTPYDLPGQTEIRARIHNRVLQLTNSGKVLDEFPVFAPGG